MTPRKTVSCLNVYLPSVSDTLQAPKICAVAHTSLLHKVQIVSVVILHLLRLAGDGSVSYVEARQKEVRLADPELAIGQLWRKHRCHQLICGILKYIFGNVSKICVLGLLVWWCVQAHTCYNGCFYRLD